MALHGISIDHMS